MKRSKPNGPLMDQPSLVQLRHDLHRHPELSGQECSTAARVVEYFQQLDPDSITAELGGHGVAIEFRGEEPGPTVLLRCELDALPIEEPSGIAHRSVHDRISHKCGHDGHMSVLAGVGQSLHRRRPARGRVVLLFQPAEETGAGALTVLNDPRFAPLTPDYAFALHNMPGHELGTVVVRPGSLLCASRGMTARLNGRTAHAAQPETGISPSLPACAIVEGLHELRHRFGPDEPATFATVVGVRVGAAAFGTSPGDGEVMATLRSESDTSMQRLVEAAVELVETCAQRGQLEHSIEWCDVFPATVNGRRAVEVIRQAADDHGSPVVTPEQPIRWSEDFGHFTQRCEGALFGLGSGVEQPPLHDPAYDFPDALIPHGVRLFEQIVEQLLHG